MGLQEGAKMSAHQRYVGVPTGLKSSHSQLQKFHSFQIQAGYKDKSRSTVAFTKI